MSPHAWETIQGCILGASIVALAALVFGFAYAGCKVEKEAYKVCIEHHTPAECRER